MKLSPTMQRFILHWGEMGTRWGVNRSVSQIHALLYLSPHPQAADEIADTLNIARSNVSTSLKELMNWELVTLSSVLGDRRDHFTTSRDPWELALKIIDGRKKREIDPTVALLRDCAEQAQNEADMPMEVRQRIDNMLGFTSDMANWYEDIKKLKRGTLLKLLKMGARIGKYVGE